jgi:hypothetical protein
MNSKFRRLASSKFKKIIEGHRIICLLFFEAIKGLCGLA